MTKDKSIKRYTLNTYYITKCSSLCTMASIYSYLKCVFLFKQLYRFFKTLIPESTDEKEAFAEKLMEYKVSITDYKEALKMSDINMYVCAG